MKKLYPLLLCCLFTWNRAHAQAVPDSMLIEVSGLHDSTQLKNNALIFIDSMNIANTGNLASMKFMPFKTYKKTDRSFNSCVIRPFYLKFSLADSSEAPVKLFFHPGLMYDRIDLYVLNNDGTMHILPKDSNNAWLQYFEVKPGGRQDFIAVLQFDRSNANGLNPILVSHAYIDTFREMIYNSGGEIRAAGFIVSGILLMMVIFMVTNFLLGRKKEYLYNSLYSLCMFLLFFTYALLSKQTSSFASFFYSYLDFVLLVFGTIFYIAFTRKFLNTKVSYPFLNKLFRAEELVLLALILFYSFIHFFTDLVTIEALIENTMKVLTLLLGAVYIVVALRQKSKLLNYLAIGNIALIVFGSVSFLLLLSNIRGSKLYISSLFYYEIGIVLELIFFLYGLAYKNRTELIERTRMEEAIKLETEKQTFEKQLAILHAQQEERNRISTDMHDDLGSGMTAIRLYSELAKKKISGSIPEIEKISSSADELINKMNTIIWTMSSSNDTLGNLISYIRSYSLEYLEDKGINCGIQIDNKDPNINVPGLARRNVFLIVKETLNNILKHAKASKVDINYTEAPGLFKLSIHDNGVGIDMENLREFGNGLKNMKKRAESIGCKYSIENVKEGGTMTTLEYVF